MDKCKKGWGGVIYFFFLEFGVVRKGKGVWCCGSDGKMWWSDFGGIWCVVCYIGLFMR